MGELDKQEGHQPTRIILPNIKINSINCGDFHSAAIDEFGNLFTWGCNYNGQLGLGDKNDRFHPHKIHTFYENELKESKILKVKCGPDFSICLTKEGNFKNDHDYYFYLILLLILFFFVKDLFILLEKINLES